MAELIVVSLSDEDSKRLKRLEAEGMENLGHVMHEAVARALVMLELGVARGNAGMCKNPTSSEERERKRCRKREELGIEGEDPVLLG